ncbi:MAG: CobD/CbiB family cobalamin biosynthesis protein, partial [Pseudomonadota bacterium]
MSAVAMLIAWVTEAAVGWPEALYRRIRHPVVWIGSLITWFDRQLNQERIGDSWRIVAGALVAFLVILITWLIAAMVLAMLPANVLAVVVAGFVGSSLLASRSLYEHVQAVAEPLAAGSIVEAREAVSHIVGRDPSQLDEAGIARAAIESLAENASDGVVAPLFWG